MRFYPCPSCRHVFFPSRGVAGVLRSARCKSAALIVVSCVPLRDSACRFGGAWEAGGKTQRALPPHWAGYGTLEKNSSGPCDSHRPGSRDVFAVRDGRPCIAEHDWGGVTRSGTSDGSVSLLGTREMLIRVLFCFVRPCELSLTRASLALGMAWDAGRSRTLLDRLCCEQCQEA